MSWTPDPPSSVAASVTSTPWRYQPDSLGSASVLAVVTGAIESDGGGSSPPPPPPPPPPSTSSSTIAATVLSPGRIRRPSEAATLVSTSRNASSCSGSTSPITSVVTDCGPAPGPNTSVPVAGDTSPGTPAVTPLIAKSTETVVPVGGAGSTATVNDAAVVPALPSGTSGLVTLSVSGSSSAIVTTADDWPSVVCSGSDSTNDKVSVGSAAWSPRTATWTSMCCWPGANSSRPDVGW